MLLCADPRRYHFGAENPLRAEIMSAFAILLAAIAQALTLTLTDRKLYKNTEIFSDKPPITKPIQYITL